MVEDWKDVMTLSYIGCVWLGSRPLKIVTGPLPEVEIRVYMGGLEFRDRERGREQAVLVEVGSNGRAYRAFLGVGGEGSQSFGSRCL